MTAEPSTKVMSRDRRLTAAEFQGLADVPTEIEWYANLGPAATKRAYKTAISDFMRFTSIARPEDFRIVTRAHVIAWRDDLVKRQHGAAPAVIPFIAVRVPVRKKRRHP